MIFAQQLFEPLYILFIDLAKAIEVPFVNHFLNCFIAYGLIHPILVVDMIFLNQLSQFILSDLLQ